MEPVPVLPSIDSLPAEIQTEVLLRVPTPAALVHAAAASKIWRGCVAGRGFLARYRERHRCSPFLGLYVPRQTGGTPQFYVPESILKESDLDDAITRATNVFHIVRYQDHRLHDADAAQAFVLGDPGLHRPCGVLDCHNSRLLLTRGHEALEVRSPLSRETVLIPFPPHVVHPDRFTACLLQGHGHDDAKAFRVVFLQHRRQGRNREARAVEYDSRRKSWQEHPWETLQGNVIEGTPGELMRARHWVFCTYTRGKSAVALLLDARNMQFSILPLPNHRNFAIGELDDNACCFVESGGIADHRLRVWQLDENRLDWVLKKDIRMDEVLGENVRYCSPSVVSNGMALMCSRANVHFVVDLNTYTVKGEFEFIGQSAYFMQMPWPPTFSRPMTNVMNPGSSEVGNNENQHEVRDGAAPLNCMLSNEPQYLDTPAAAEQCFAKLKGVDPSITSVAPLSQLEHNGMECDNDQTLRSSHDCVNVEKPVFPTDNDEVMQDTMENLVNESETGNLPKSPNLPHCADGEGADDGGSNNQSSKVSSHEGPSAHATVTPCFNRTNDVLPTDASEPGHLPECITAQDTTMIPQPESSEAHLSALQHERGEKVNHDLEDVCASIQLMEMDHVQPETNIQPGTATEDRVAFEEENADKSSVEVSGANKAYQALDADDSIMKNDKVHGGLTAQTAPEQENGNNGTDVQKDDCRTSIPSSSMDQGINDSHEGLPQQDLCMICGEGGPLLKCSTCFFAAHDRCFGFSPSFTDEGTFDLFYCAKCYQGCMICGEDGPLLKCSKCLFAAHDRCFGSSITDEGTNAIYCADCKSESFFSLSESAVYISMLENNGRNDRT